MRNLCQIAPKPRTGRILGSSLKSEIWEHLVHPQPPTFRGFQPSESHNETSTPLYLWSLGGATGHPRPRTVGANCGSTTVPGAEKKDFFQSCPQTTWDAQVFLAHFEPVVMCFGPWKITKCLENGPFWDQKGVKNGSRTHYSKSDPGPFGVPKQVFLVHFEPLVMRFGPLKIPKCLENGAFWDQKSVKTGSKICFSKSYLGLFGVHNVPILSPF